MKVFASSSVDKTVRVWDARNKNGAVLTKDNAHDSDVNVISWNEYGGIIIVIRDILLILLF